MTAAGTPPAGEAAVLLADGDAFQGGYIEAVLVARGIAVVGPFVDRQSALEAIATPGLGAAVIADPRERQKPDRLAEELDRRGIPFLTLAPADHAAARPSLAQPFAGYQVADWVVRTLAERADSRGIANAWPNENRIQQFG
ncbi:MAG TPA: hypothetical protein VF695_14255 [Sphingomonas sp.]|jgi:hypothetical protein